MDKQLDRNGRGWMDSGRGGMAMDGQMDVGRSQMDVDGWINRQMDGWTDRCVDG